MRLKPTYIQHPDPELNGNPLTEAIQPILYRDEIERLINFTPQFSKNVHELHRIYKNTNVRRISEIYVAPPICTTLYEKLIELILDGYRYRNPLEKRMTRFLFELADRGRIVAEENKNLRPGEKKKQVHKIIPPGLTTAPGSVLSGPSGTGKTSATRAVLGIIPQVFSHAGYLEHGSFQQDQIVWISFDAPVTASPKALCLNFMLAVDTALGEKRYYPEFKDRIRGTSMDIFIAKVQEIAANHYIGLVHFDEMQFFLKYSTVENAPNLQMVEAMFNKIGVPVLFTTTEAGLLLIDENEQTARRIVSEQKFYLEPLKYDSKSFTKFVDAVFLPEVWGEDNILENRKEFIKRFHYLSAGLQAVMIRLARLHLSYCVTLEKDPFDIVQLDKVFNSQFEYMIKSLDYLRTKNKNDYEKNIKRTRSGRVSWCSDDIVSSDTNPENREIVEISPPSNPMTSEPRQNFHNPDLIGGL
tara:strand:- start:188 stop:1597 length:1410 start_codon:yes stop_codon:yes gene_type:complete